ncbi:ABC transporter permease [Microbacterium sp. bgisy207]|uniref:ABC transporter permease n=1 Tax=Microbacterium sp. bgisy207 TaxID=3413800 RepID=UPI003EBDCFB7
MSGRWRGWMLAGGVVVAVLAVATTLILLAGADPLTGLQGLVAGVSSSPYRVGELLVGAVPIAIVALTLIPALRAGVFSVGAEGQVILGAIVATAATLGTANMFGEAVPGPVYWVIGMVSGALGGAAFALLPAWLAERWHVNIILSTLLLNYIAAGFLGWTLRTWLASGENTATPQSEQLPEASALPDLIPGTRAHIGVLLIVVIAVLFEWWRRTSHATRIGVFAERPRLALRLGTTRARTLYGTMLVSGAGAGVVGWLQVAGVNERLFNSVSGGVGFSGLAVALLGALLPGGILLAALFFSALTAGALGIQSATGTVPSSIADVIKGVLLLGVAAVAGVTARSGAARPAAAPPLTDVAAVTPDGEPAPPPTGEERS